MAYHVVCDQAFQHPKFQALVRMELAGVPEAGAAGLLWVLAGSRLKASHADGFLDVLDLLQLVPDRERVLAQAAVLVRVGLWHDHDHYCGRCPRPGPGRYCFHDWRQYHRPGAVDRNNMALRAERVDDSLRSAVWARDALPPGTPGLPAGSTGALCAYCSRLVLRGSRGAAAPEIEHVVPRALGVDNLVISCRACNRSKGNKPFSTAGLELHLTPAHEAALAARPGLREMLTGAVPLPPLDWVTDPLDEPPPAVRPPSTPPPGLGAAPAVGAVPGPLEPSCGVCGPPVVPSRDPVAGGRGPVPGSAGSSRPPSPAEPAERRRPGAWSPPGGPGAATVPPAVAHAPVGVPEDPPSGDLGHMILPSMEGGGRSAPFSGSAPVGAPCAVPAPAGAPGPSVPASGGRAEAPEALECPGPVLGASLPALGPVAGGAAEAVRLLGPAQQVLLEAALAYAHALTHAGAGVRAGPRAGAVAAARGLAGQGRDPAGAGTAGRGRDPGPGRPPGSRRRRRGRRGRGRAVEKEAETG